MSNSSLHARVEEKDPSGHLYLRYFLLPLPSSVFPNITSVCLLSFSLYKWIQMKRSEVSGSKLDDTFDVCVFGTSFWQMMMMRWWWWWWQVRGPSSCCFMDRWVVVTWGYSDLIFSGMINKVCSFMQGKWALQELLFYVVCHSWSIHLSIYRLSCLHLRRYSPPSNHSRCLVILFHHQ